MSSRVHPLLTVSQLRVTRGKTSILQGIDWQVERGQHWAILGPNGCGKTSLLKSLTGYLSPSSGHIALLGEIYGESDWRELRRHIGIVTAGLTALVPPAEPALETVMSGRYAQLDLWAKTTLDDRRQAHRWLRFVEADHLAAREWIYLSQGERQRVLIARALMAQPKLLILDEPCAGLDPVAREHFLRFLDQLASRRSAPTLVLVTHHVEEITAAFTHVLLLHAGRTLAAGPIKSTLTSSALSAAFASPLKLARRGARWQLQLGEEAPVSAKKRAGRGRPAASLPKRSVRSV